MSLTDILFSNTDPAAGEEEAKILMAKAAKKMTKRKPAALLRSFAMFGRGSLVVKLPKERAEALVSSGRWLSVEVGAFPWVPLAKEAHGDLWRGKR